MRKENADKYCKNRTFIFPTGGSHLGNKPIRGYKMNPAQWRKAKGDSFIFSLHTFEVTFHGILNVCSAFKESTVKLF